MASDSGPIKFEKMSILPGGPAGGHLINSSVDFIDNHVNKELHSALSDSGFSYDSQTDRFAAEKVATHADKTLFECQQAFKDELQKYVETTRTTSNTGIDLVDNHTWDDVIKQAKIARDEYRGVDKKGIVKTLDKGFKSFTTAAPAIEAWLRLLPSTSIYGSVAAIRLRKLSTETFEALDQIPLRVETAQFFMQTYQCTNIEEHAAHLYQAIIEALQHILSWYKQKAGMKYLGSICKGSAYACALRTKMKNVEEASQAIDGRAGLNYHRRLEEIRSLSWKTVGQLNSVERRTEELRNLQLEARNSLYAFFKDKETWQAIQIWASSENGKKSRRPTLNQQKRSIAATNSLLRLLDYNSDIMSRNVADGIRQISSLTLADQDRAKAITADPIVSQWIVQADSGALLVHGNGKRHETISPTSVASAVLINLFNKLQFITLHWFCGYNISGLNGNALGMIRNLVGQLLSEASFKDDFEVQASIDGENLGELLKLLKRLVRELSKGSIVICIIDGISYYEAQYQRDDTCKFIRQMIKLMRAEDLRLKLLMTSPTRTRYIAQEAGIARDIRIVEIPEHINGSRQGLNYETFANATEEKMRDSLKN